MLVTSKPEGIGLLLGLCYRLFAHGEGRSGDICGCGHSGRRKRGEGSMEKWAVGLKYARLTQPPVPHPSPSHHLSPGAYITHTPFLLTTFTSTHHTRFIPLVRLTLFLSIPQYPLCTSFSDVEDTILPVISLRHVTNFR